MAEKTLGIIFMGGKGQRMGGVDKSKIMVGEHSCFDRVYNALSLRTAHIALSRAYGGGHTVAPVIPDWPTAASKSSPALALLGCLSYAANNGFCQIVTSSVDTPFLPMSLFGALSTKGLSATAKTQSQIHGLHARWSCALLPSLKSRILDGQYGIRSLHKDLGSDEVEFSTHPIDPFFNINLPNDLEEARKLAQKFNL